MDNGFILIKRYDYINGREVHGVDKDDIIFLKTLEEVRFFIVNDIKEHISYLETIGASHSKHYNNYIKKENFDLQNSVSGGKSSKAINRKIIADRKALSFLFFHVPVTSRGIFL